MESGIHLYSTFPTPSQYPKALYKGCSYTLKHCIHLLLFCYPPLDTFYKPLWPHKSHSFPNPSVCHSLI